MTKMAMHNLEDINQILFNADLFGTQCAHNPGMEGLMLNYCPNAPLTHNGKLMTTANMAVIEFDDLLNPTLIAFQRPGDL